MRIIDERVHKFKNRHKIKAIQSIMSNQVQIKLSAITNTILLDDSY